MQDILGQVRKCFDGNVVVECPRDANAATSGSGRITIPETEQQGHPEATPSSNPESTSKNPKSSKQDTKGKSKEMEYHSVIDSSSKPNSSDARAVGYTTTNSGLETAPPGESNASTSAEMALQFRPGSLQKSAFVSSVDYATPPVRTTDIIDQWPDLLSGEGIEYLDNVDFSHGLEKSSATYGAASSVEGSSSTALLDFEDQPPGQYRTMPGFFVKDCKC